MLPLLLLITSFLTVASPVTVTVTEKTAGQSDSIVRQNARIKAQYAGIERLPVVMSGYEKLTDKDFTSNIKAYLVGEVNVLTLREDWNRQKGIFTLTAQVSLNHQASLEMVEGIRNNLALQKKLKNLYLALDKLSNDKSIASNDFEDVYDRIMSVKGGALIRDSIASSIAAKEEFLANSYRYFNKRYIEPLLESVEIKVTSLDDKKVYYTAFIKKDRKIAQEIKDYWNDNPTRKAAYKRKMPTICFPYSVAVKNLLFNDYKRDFSIEHGGDERFASEPHKFIYPVLCYIKPRD
jgi:hypothetical protein